MWESAGGHLDLRNPDNANPSEAGGAHSTPVRRRKRERERLNCTTMEYGAVDREECVYMAKLAEQVSPPQPPAVKQKRFFFSPLPGLRFF